MPVDTIGPDSEEKPCVSQIDIGTDNAILKEIVTSLNMYLQKNKGAASDFYLMKDVVERYCDAEEEEITIQQPIPLYLGLMGTMTGIIIGIVFIAVSGGLSNESLMDNLTSLMTCVAIAMGASLVGILCTTILSWKAKNATVKVESAKNRFYSWLQTELLPMLSGNTANALHLLHHNLSMFNQTFQANISGLDSVLAKVRDSSREQAELVSLIRNLDIKRVSEANVRVLRELKDCTDEIEIFNKYMHNVSQYLSAVNDLNTNVNEHLNRTAAIERMGTFFEQEILQIESRKQYINQVVAQVDNTLLKTFGQLSESTTRGITDLRNMSVSEFESVLKIFEEQRQDFRMMLQAQRDELSGCATEVKKIIADWDIVDIKTIMSALLKSSEEQAVSVNRLIDAMHKHLVVESRTENVIIQDDDSNTNGIRPDSVSVYIPSRFRGVIKLCGLLMMIAAIVVSVLLLVWHLKL